MEAAVDAEISKADALDDDGYAKIKQKRVAEMKKQAAERQMNQANGHGSLTKGDQKDFFTVTKQSTKVVAIFSRNSNKYGKAMLEHAELLAQKHLEARFIWVDAENAPFLTDKLNIYMLPTICCIMDNKVHKQHNGLNASEIAEVLTAVGITPMKRRKEDQGLLLINFTEVLKSMGWTREQVVDEIIERCGPIEPNHAPRQRWMTHKWWVCSEMDTALARRSASRESSSATRWTGRAATAAVGSENANATSGW